MKHFKLIGVLVLLVLVIIITLQNTEEVQTKILFINVNMPRAILLFVTALIGFGLGILVAFLVRRKEDQAPKEKKRTDHPANQPPIIPR